MLQAGLSRYIANHQANNFLVSAFYSKKLFRNNTKEFRLKVISINLIFFNKYFFDFDETKIRQYNNREGDFDYFVTWHRRNRLCKILIIT